MTAAVPGTSASRGYQEEAGDAEVAGEWPRRAGEHDLGCIMGTSEQQPWGARISQGEYSEAGEGGPRIGSQVVRPTHVGQELWVVSSSAATGLMDKPESSSKEKAGQKQTDLDQAPTLAGHL